MAMTEMVSLRLPTELVRRLEEVAEREDRSRSWIIRQACEAYLREVRQRRSPKTVVG
jgi:predicted transcriptional regulator